MSLVLDQKIEAAFNLWNSNFSVSKEIGLTYYEFAGQLRLEIFFLVKSGRWTLFNYNFVALEKQAIFRLKIPDWNFKGNQPANRFGQKICSQIWWRNLGQLSFSEIVYFNSTYMVNDFSILEVGAKCRLGLEGIKRNSRSG